MAILAQSLEVTIPNGAAVSAAFNIDSFPRGTFHMPAAWTAASIGFQVSPSFGGTYQPLSDDSGIIALTVAVDSSYLLPANLAGARFVKFWSHTAGTPVNQGADRVIGVDLKA